ncbi:thioesterase II family protein [Arthrobacter sp. UM1]|uniref:thioesterase II family protein n=1 Tax=Arthrobacter sp. UM1 TaxID=2766776 RepID=UPI001CF6AA58|nr:alpha/beta fold hydrolase [Arthrobacter sp. UM1]MCB4208799.1 thioesterase [Arthrobacter sp. UM1]
MTDHFEPASSCLRRFHEGPRDGNRIVLFPFAGGNASSFFRFSELLAEEYDVWVVQYPGRLDRWDDTLPESVAALAREVVDAVDWSDSRPVSFFGHSMGAVVAFEATRMAELRGFGVASLVASASAPPQMAGERVARHLDDLASVRALEQLADLPSGALEGDATRDFLLKPLRADCRILSDYRPDDGVSVSANLLLAGGSADEDLEVSSLMGWSRLTRGTVTVKVFEGDHFYLWKNLASLVSWLGRELAPSQS